MASADKIFLKKFVEAESDPWRQTITYTLIEADDVRHEDSRGVWYDYQQTKLGTCTYGWDYIDAHGGPAAFAGWAEEKLEEEQGARG